jgi:hypothetical protein
VIRHGDVVDYAVDWWEWCLTDFLRVECASGLAFDDGFEGEEQLSPLRCGMTTNDSNSNDNSSGNNNGNGKDRDPSLRSG